MTVDSHTKSLFMTRQLLGYSDGPNSSFEADGFAAAQFQR